MRRLTSVLFVTMITSCCRGAHSPAPQPEAPARPEPPASPPPPVVTEPEPPKHEWPDSRRDDVVDTLHGVKVADPYRWLEKVDDEVTRWMDAQDAYARKGLASLPDRDALRARFEELTYIDVPSPPHREGNRFFYWRQAATQEKGVLYMREGEKGKEQVLIDPNALSVGGKNISLGGWSPSQDGRYLAYRLREDGADAATLYVRDLDTGKDLDKDVIQGARYAFPSWTPDAKGFYYVWLPTDPSIPVDQLPGKREVRYHRLGTDPATDEIVKPALNDPTKMLGVDLSRDGRWLLLYEMHGWTRTDIYLRDRRDPKGTFQPLVVGNDARYGVDAWKDQLYITTNEGAPRFRVFKAPAKKPGREHWKEIVPERADAVLDGAYVVGGKLVLVYTRNASTEVEIHGLDGKLVRKVKLPGIGSASGLMGRPDLDDAYYGFTSFTQPYQIFKTSVKSGKSTLWAEIKVPVDTSNLTSSQVWYASKDGTKVSMFLVHRKDLAKTGDNPALLTGYGGFSQSMTPYFSGSVATFVDAGGVVAIPNLRGGGEYGEDWHRSGMLENKQNVFDDFIAAAEYLIAEKITRADRLAISGGSNGGLLVGAAMVQRPELFRAVACAVPLLDMVRYHLFGAGRTWISEYGSAEDEKLFPTLHAYSPYHHVQDGTRYPALLMLSADNDDRVDPMHARKFVAAIQRASTSGLPVWLRIERQAGHGGADQRKQTVEQQADTYAFLSAQLGMTFKR
jgi:prolyl oligopeptidase